MRSQPGFAWLPEESLCADNVYTSCGGNGQGLPQYDREQYFHGNLNSLVKRRADVVSYS
jgi:hypothetical protein